MDNLTISVALTKLKNAGFAELKGKTGQKRCVVIPVEDNPEIKEISGEAYLNLIGFPKKEADKYGNTHLVKGSWPKELRDKMTQDEKYAQPILGNVKVQGVPHPAENTGYEPVADDDDLPF